MNLFDIHCHVLPFVDDGPKSLDEAVAILDESRSQGIRYMILTPHFRRDMFEPSRQQVIESFQMLKEEAKARGIQIFLGCEYFRSSEVYEQIRGKRRVSMAGSPYILVEFSGNDTFTYVRNYAYELKSYGYQVIIAHVERYESCWSLARIAELKDCGIQIQVNAATVLGKTGWKNKQMCLQLMKEDLIDYIGSDTHDTKTRTQNLGKCANYVAKKMGEDYARKIFYDNPSNILRSR